MAGTSNDGRRRHFLLPIERISEVLFGLIMVLTFTGSLSVANAGHEDVRTMLTAALGCNLAWGAIDAVFYLMGTLADRGSDLATAHAVRSAGDPADAHRRIADALPPHIAAAVGPTELEAIRVRIVAQVEPPRLARLGGRDLAAALAVALWVFVATLPVALPFVFMHEPKPALRVSNAIAIALLYASGHAYARLTGRSPIRMGLAMVVLGILLVSLTIALGG